VTLLISGQRNWKLQITSQKRRSDGMSAINLNEQKH